MENKYEHIKFIIQRFDHYYDTVNSKGAFYIGLNTFIFGGLCAGYISLHKELAVGWLIWTLLGILMTSSIACTIFTIRAIKPYRKDNQGNINSPSLMFFEGIAKHEFSFLKEKMDQQTPERITEDALCQMHSLARGLSDKFRNLSIASNLLWAQFVVMVPLFLLIIKNLN